jgi:acetyl-CoA carboxylase biotin carboxyl carrier protein
MRVGGRPPSFAPDAELIRMLAELLTETGLSEIEYALGEQRIRVARNAAPLMSGSVSGGGDSGTVVPGAPEPLPPGERATPFADRPGAVTAPMVGIAFLAPQPGSAPFVRVGDTVSAGQTLLIIEAMKVMNQIQAPQGGQVTRILVADSQPVEYGAPLMLVE